MMNLFRKKEETSPSDRKRAKDSKTTDDAERKLTEDGKNNESKSEDGGNPDEGTSASPAMSEPATDPAEVTRKSSQQARSSEKPKKAEKPQTVQDENPRANKEKTDIDDADRNKEAWKQVPCDFEGNAVAVKQTAVKSTSQGDKARDNDKKSDGKNLRKSRESEGVDQGKSRQRQDDGKQDRAEDSGPTMLKRGTKSDRIKAREAQPGRGEVPELKRGSSEKEKTVRPTASEKATAHAERDQAVGRGNEGPERNKALSEGQTRQAKDRDGGTTTNRESKQREEATGTEEKTPGRSKKPQLSQATKASEPQSGSLNGKDKPKETPNPQGKTSPPKLDASKAKTPGKSHDVAERSEDAEKELLKTSHRTGKRDEAENSRRQTETSTETTRQSNKFRKAVNEPRK